MGASFRCAEHSDVFWIILKPSVHCAETGMCKPVLQSQTRDGNYLATGKMWTLWSRSNAGVKPFRLPLVQLSANDKWWMTICYRSIASLLLDKIRKKTCSRLQGVTWETVIDFWARSLFPSVCENVGKKGIKVLVSKRDCRAALAGTRLVKFFLLLLIQVNWPPLRVFEVDVFER